jgi:O-antigen ligase
MDKISSRHIVHRQIFYFCCLALVFFLPVYGRLLPPVILVMVLNWLIDGQYIKTFPRIFKERKRWTTLSFALIYLIYLAGLLYSSNYKYGWFDLEIKLSLFLFPLIFSTTDDADVDPVKIKFILKIFILGCFTGSVILLLHALFSKLVYHTVNSFVYSNFSWSFHPSYFATYISFAIAIAADFLFVNSGTMNLKSRLGLIFLILFFFMIVFLLSSKAGIGTLLLIAVFYTFIIIFRKRMIKLGIGLILTAAFCFYAAFNLFPYVGKRINKANSSQLSGTPARNDTSSTVERLVIWQTSGEIIKRHFIFGVGTGDVKDTLMKAYKEKGLDKVYEHKLNTHNQYLQTFIALGFIGFLVLAAMFIFPAIGAARAGNYLYLAFIMIFSFNILVESMLEVQAGVVFFAFFNAFFFWTSRSLVKSTNNMAT